ncbi:MAG TPA: cellulase family glycosylhydrolase [Chitinophagaceae bacterium]|nr:cellulase family glycosylhydrolase [Chitinophagaceae bacterium]
MALLFVLIMLTAKTPKAQGFLRREGQNIVNNNGNFLIKSMGLGGWMLQEPYMLQLSGVASNQQEIKRKIKEVIGEEKTDVFYTAWQNNFITKGDIDSMAAWGFNAVRLPMHYNLYTPPVEEEKEKGKNTWIERGFVLTDSLLSWCKSAKLYLILDLHAAPGGQGADIAISDRDPSKPSLWQSEAAQQKTIALWKKLAQRYAAEPWIGGYDLINETNWGFQDSTDKNGCSEKINAPLKKLLQDITAAIREVDKNHTIFLEANCWANNYSGMFPLWDSNMVVSFHKYWNYNDKASIQQFIKIRAEQNVPLWCGESGENSNNWFQSAIALLEENNIGWAWWPLKKLGISNPLQIKSNDAYNQLINYWKAKGEKPTPEAAFSGLMQLAKDSRIENAMYHKDVTDALFRQVASTSTIPFKKENIKNGSLLFAVDYDLGKTGFAYYDLDTANYRVATGKNIISNKGGQYRNDGVDIEQCSDSITNGYNVGWTESEEWLQYTVNVANEGIYEVGIRAAAKDSTGQVQVIVNDSFTQLIKIPKMPAGVNWTTTNTGKLFFKKGINKIRVKIIKGGVNLNYFKFTQSKK